ncbi:MAG TPA: KilA-N domain-containing protein, partial [Allocoleopsis sp.]
MTILSYNGNQIQQRADGFVNLTQMAQANGVKINHWYSLSTTREYIEALESDTGMSASQLITVYKGNSKDFSQGTWGHPLLALNFGRWINPKFAIWCDQHIKTLIETGSTQLIQTPPKKAITYYTDRIMDLKHSLIKPPGTWCVIEKCSHLLLEVERLG